MILKSFNLKKEFKDNVNFYLLYGPNSGFIEETINNVLKPNLSKNVYNYEENEILSNVEDNYQSLSVIAQNFFKEKRIGISNQNINYIVERAKGNRINLKNELKKIENYCLNKKSIEFNEISKLTNLSENYDISELVNQCIARNKNKTLHILNENNSLFEDNILILKTFL